MFDGVSVLTLCLGCCQVPAGQDKSAEKAAKAILKERQQLGKAAQKVCFHQSFPATFCSHGHQPRTASQWLPCRASLP